MTTLDPLSCPGLFPVSSDGAAGACEFRPGELAERTPEAQRAVDSRGSRGAREPWGFGSVWERPMSGGGKKHPESWLAAAKAVEMVASTGVTSCLR